MTLADSGTYTPETIARKKKLAEALLMKSMDPRQIDHWTQGAAQMAQAGVGAYAMRKADDEDKADRSEMARFLQKMMQNGSPASAPGIAPSPSAPPSSAPMAEMPPKPGTMYADKTAATPDGAIPLPPRNPLQGLDPEFRTKFADLRSAAADKGVEFNAGEGFRPQERQNALYAQGRTAPGPVVTQTLNSNHTSGRANDVRPVNTSADAVGRTISDLISTNPQFAGMRSGANFKGLYDPLHVELNKPGMPQPGNWPVARVPDAAPPGPALAFNGQPNSATDAPMPGGAPSPAMAAANPQQMPQQAAQPPQSAPSPNPAMAQQLQAPPSAQPPQPDMKAQIATMLQSKSPRVQAMGQALAQSVISTQMAGDKPTDEMREYQLYQKQGGKDSFFDYKSGLKKAGAIQNSVQIDQKGESAFSTEAGKLQAKRFNDLAEDAPAAKQMLSDVEVLRDLGSKIGTGKGAEVTASLGPFAQALGIDIKGLDEIQGFEAIVNRVAPNLRVKGSGAQSDYELKNFLKSIPSIGATPGGNEITSKVLEGLYQNKLAASEIGAKALSKEITPSQAEKMIRDLPDPLKDWREFKKAEIGRAHV